MHAADDACELLTWLSPTPACAVLLMEQLGWTGTRFANAVHGIRERHNIRVRTTDRETIRVRRRLPRTPPDELTMRTARTMLAAMLIATAANGCALLPTPTRDQLMRMEQGYSLAVDAAEAATAAGQLDDRQRRDRARVAITQAKAALVEAREAVKASGGVKLAADSAPVARYDAALARFRAAIAEGEAEAVRQAAARERRSNEFLNELFGAPSATPPATRAGQP